MVVKNREFDEEDTNIESSGCVLDPTLYKMLKDLRKDTAKKLKLPPYVIFQDVSIEQMATVYPITLNELQNIQGVGAGKAKRYGKGFVELIKNYCEDNEIERPSDMRVKTVANKSLLKVSIIESIDRQVDLDDLADSKNIDFSELLDEMEAIVYSGTRINIDYFIDDTMDEEDVEDVYEYFRESETDSLEEAMKEFGEDYSEEEIRLIRIKFISEMAN